MERTKLEVVLKSQSSGSFGSSQELLGGMGQRALESPEQRQGDEEEGIVWGAG